MIRKILKITGISILALLLILFIAPFLFKGKIIALAKKEINGNINAHADFSDASLSLFRHFPRISLALENLHITGIGGFEKDTLIAAKNIDVALNLMSVIRGNNMKIYSVEVEQPRITAIVDKQGKANWDIMKEDTAVAASQEEKPFNLELKHYSISDAFIQYADSTAGIYSRISHLNHEGSGDFTADVFTLSTQTTADEVDVSYGGIPYLFNTKVKIDADIQVDNKADKYTFKTDEVSLNALKLSTNGFFQFVNDSTYNMDISFNAPSTDFKNILSLVPVVYQKDFDKIKTSGEAVFNGFVKGTMSEDKLPSYNINLDVKNGYFQYPDLPTPMKDILLTLKVDNPDGVTDHTVVNIPKGHFVLGNDPFDFSLLVKNPVTDMFVDAMAKGKIDLSKITQLVKLDDGTRIKGLLNADVTAKGSVEAAEKQQFDRFNAAGTISLTDFLYASNDYPDGIILNAMRMVFNPRNVTIEEANGKYLNTGFQANGSINNFIGYALKDDPLSGVFNIKADKVNLNDFMGDEDTTASSSSSGPFIVPDKMNITINAKADEIDYDKLIIRDLSGALQLKDEAVLLNDVAGKALDGNISISGSYSTRVSKTKPDIALHYNVQDVDVQKTFYAFNTVQKLMPAGRWLGGRLSSELSLTGKLGEDMMPDLSTLTGNGSLLIIQGFLKKFAPLEKLADRLNIKELQDITLREVRQYFEFANGKVLVKPFKFHVQNIDMEVAGIHGIDQTINYTIDMMVPRSLIGNQGNQVINDLVTKANARGINVKPGETINLKVNMGGTITNPTINLNLKEAAGSLADELKEQAKEFAKAKIDSAKKTVSDTLQSLKKEAVKEVSDRLKKELFGKKDSTIADSSKKQDPAARARESAKGLLKDINPFKKKKTDTTKQ